jgi:hypothetical protein
MAAGLRPVQVLLDAQGMRCERIAAPVDWDDTRGPELARWLIDEDLRFPDVGKGYGPPVGSIVGAESHDHWAIFHGLQVIQIIPDEVHSGWHYEFMDHSLSPGSAWRIIDSQWKKTFDPRHLAGHSHFIIRFYDDVIELICRDIVFGPTPFDLVTAIEVNPKLSYPYLQRAISLQESGDTEGAIASFEKYLQLEPDPSSVPFARRCIERLRAQ